MTQSELTAYHQDIYNALIDALDRLKKMPGHFDEAQLLKIQRAVEAALIIRDELRSLLPPEQEPVQVALLDVPRKGGY